MAVDDLREDVGHIGLRIDAIEFAGFDERRDDRPVLCAAVGAGEERIFAIEGNGSDGAFDDIGVDLDPSVIDEAGEAVPARERVADRFGKLGLLADQREFFAQPGFERVDDWAGFVQSRRTPFVCVASANVFFNGVKRDARQRLLGDRCLAGGGEVIEAPADVRSAEGERHAVFLRQRAIAGVAIDLHDAAEPRKMRERLLGFSVLRVDIDGDRRIDAAERPVVARIGPKLTGLGASAPRIQHGCSRFVGEDFRRGADMLQKPLMHGAQMPGGAANPVGER